MKPPGRAAVASLTTLAPSLLANEDAKSHWGFRGASHGIEWSAAVQPTAKAVEGSPHFRCEWNFEVAHIMLRGAIEIPKQCAPWGQSSLKSLNSTTMIAFWPSHETAVDKAIATRFDWSHNADDAGRITVNFNVQHKLLHDAKRLSSFSKIAGDFTSIKAGTIKARATHHI